MQSLMLNSQYKKHLWKFRNTSSSHSVDTDPLLLAVACSPLTSCSLPPLERLSAHEILQSVRHTTFVLIGDSVARQQFSGMACAVMTAMLSSSAHTDFAQPLHMERVLHESTELANRLTPFYQRELRLARPSLGNEPIHALRFKRLGANLIFLQNQGLNGSPLYAESISLALRQSFPYPPLRRVSIVVSIGPHYNNPGVFTLRDEMRTLAELQETKSTIAVLESVPQHYCGSTGLWDEEMRGIMRCCPIQTSGRSYFQVSNVTSCETLFPVPGRQARFRAMFRASEGTKFDRDACSMTPWRAEGDFARLRGNWRNSMIEAGLRGSSVPIIRIFRALLPTHDNHRGKGDCTHIGLPQITFVVRALLQHMSTLADEQEKT
jgi:hypothetical protein